MSHDTKPAPCLSDDAKTRRPVIPHAGKRSVHTDATDPETRLQEANPAAGSGAGADGPPTTGWDYTSGIPMGFA
jgi:hypothetical protein